MLKCAFDVAINSKYMGKKTKTVVKKLGSTFIDTNETEFMFYRLFFFFLKRRVCQKHKTSRRSVLELWFVMDNLLITTKGEEKHLGKWKIINKKSCHRSHEQN